MDTLKILLIIGLIVYILKINSKKGQKIVVNKDFITPSISLDEKVEYKPFNSTYKKAWTDSNVNKNPIFHSSQLEGEKTSLGDFFDKDNKYISQDRSKLYLPDRCFIDNDELICKFNNRIENPPPTLIEDKENNMVLKNIGDDKNINTNIVSPQNIVFGKNNHNVWEYENEKTMNGGKYFKHINGDVSGYSESDGVLDLSTIKGTGKSYSI